jgi:transcriptional regulator
MQTDSELTMVLNETVNRHGAGQPVPWNPNLSNELKTKLHQAIVGFEIEVTRIEGKFKLGQNRSREDQQKMIGKLIDSGDAESVRLAQLMESEFKQAHS